MANSSIKRIWIMIPASDEFAEDGESLESTSSKFTVGM